MRKPVSISIRKLFDHEEHDRIERVRKALAAAYDVLETDIEFVCYKSPCIDCGKKTFCGHITPRPDCKPIDVWRILPRLMEVHINGNIVRNDTIHVPQAQAPYYIPPPPAELEVVLLHDPANNIP